MNVGGIEYVSGSYPAFGNDGMHFNDSINAPPNTAVPPEVADALHYGSDHLPVAEGDLQPLVSPFFKGEFGGWLGFQYGG